MSSPVSGVGDNIQLYFHLLSATVVQVVPLGVVTITVLPTSAVPTAGDHNVGVTTVGELNKTVKVSKDEASL
jgi:hypothetical protein